MMKNYLNKIIVFALAMVSLLIILKFYSQYEKLNLIPIPQIHGEWDGTYYFKEGESSLNFELVFIDNNKVKFQRPIVYPPSAAWQITAQKEYLYKISNLTEEEDPNGLKEFTLEIENGYIYKSTLKNDTLTLEQTDQKPELIKLRRVDS